MRIALIGLAALIAGIAGTLAYDHFLGEGASLTAVQADLAKARSDLANAANESHQAKSENEALTAQVQQLNSSKDELKKQLEEAKTSSAPATPSPFGNFSKGAMGDMVKAQIAERNEEKLQTLKARLHLTPEQEAAVKAAMDDESKQTQAMTAKMFSGEKFDPQSMARDPKAKTVDQVLQDILTPEQKTGYQQMKTEEKSSSAEMMASVEMTQMAPSLQLNDTQKDQVVGALYQAQLNEQDPEWIKKNMTPSAGDPMAVLDAQAKVKEDALAKILTPDQLAIYHQQAQSRLNMQKAMMKNFMPAGGASATVHTAP